MAKTLKNRKSLTSRALTRSKSSCKSHKSKSSHKSSKSRRSKSRRSKSVGGEGFFTRMKETLFTGKNSQQKLEDMRKCLKTSDDIEMCRKTTGN